MTAAQRKAALYNLLLPEQLIKNILTSEVDAHSIKPLADSYKAYFSKYLEGPLLEFLIADNKFSFTEGARLKGFRTGADKKSAYYKNVVFQLTKNFTVEVYDSKGATVRSIRTISLFDWKKVSVDANAVWYNGSLILQTS